MPRSENSRAVTCIKSNMLTIMTVAGVFGGSIAGLILRASSETKWTPREVMYLQFPGDIFLRMLKCLIVPLLMSSIISAIGSLDLSLSKKIAYRSIALYSTTTVCAVILGIFLVVTIRPGVGKSFNLNVDSGDKAARNVLTVDTLMDLIRNMFPPNIVEATISQYRTILKPPINVTHHDLKQVPLNDYIIKSELSDSTNVLGLVVFSIALGISIGKLGTRGKPLLDFFESCSEATMIITRWVIWLSPLGVFFLVAAKIMEIESLQEIVGQLGFYFMTVLLGLFIHGFGTLSVIYFLCTRSLPFKFLAGMSQVIATAFGTASSSATMPVTIENMDKQGVDPRVSRFVIPIGATINMDGTALYEAVAAVFISQIRKVPLSLGNIVAVSITATAASIGAAGIPQAGLVTMVMVLDTVGLPADDVTLIIAVDWLLDRFRTTINVMCDAMVAKIVDCLSKEELSNLKYTDIHEMEEMANKHDHLETRNKKIISNENLW